MLAIGRHLAIVYPKFQVHCVLLTELLFRKYDLYNNYCTIFG